MSSAHAHNVETYRYWTEFLSKTIDCKGRYDYDINELVWVSFLTEKGLIIKEFGIVNEKVGDQYIVKLLINDPNDIAVVSIYALTGAGLA